MPITIRSADGSTEDIEDDLDPETGENIALRELSKAGYDVGQKLYSVDDSSPVFVPQAELKDALGSRQFVAVPLSSTGDKSLDAIYKKSQETGAPVETLKDQARISGTVLPTDSNLMQAVAPAGGIANKILFNAPSFVQKKLQGEAEEKAIDSLRPELQAAKPFAQRGVETVAEFVSPLNRIGMAAKSASTLGRVASAAAGTGATSAAQGVFESRSGQEAESGLIGGTVGAATGGLFEGAAKGLQAMSGKLSQLAEKGGFSGVADRLKSFAGSGEPALEAAARELGEAAEETGSRQIAKGIGAEGLTKSTKRAVASSGGETELGRFVAEEGLTGPLTSKATTLTKAEALSKQIKGRLDDNYKELDKWITDTGQEGVQGIDADNLLQKIRAEVVEPLKKNETTIKLADRLENDYLKAFEELNTGKKLSFSEARQKATELRNIAWDSFDGNKNALKRYQKALDDTGKILREESLRSAEEIGGKNTKPIVDQIRKDNKRISKSINVEGLARAAIERRERGKTFGLTDSIIAGGGIAGGLATGDPENALYGAALVAPKKLAERYGNQMVGTGLRKVGLGLQESAKDGTVDMLTRSLAREEAEDARRRLGLVP